MDECMGASSRLRVPQTALCFVLGHSGTPEGLQAIVTTLSFDVLRGFYRGIIMDGFHEVDAEYEER